MASLLPLLATPVLEKMGKGAVREVSHQGLLYPGTLSDGDSENHLSLKDLPFPPQLPKRSSFVPTAIKGSS